jgi:hypothetical protein
VGGREGHWLVYLFMNLFGDIGRKEIPRKASRKPGINLRRFDGIYKQEMTKVTRRGNRATSRIYVSPSNEWPGALCAVVRRRVSKYLLRQCARTRASAWQYVCAPSLKVYRDILFPSLGRDRRLLPARPPAYTRIIDVLFLDDLTVLFTSRRQSRTHVFFTQIKHI